MSAQPSERKIRQVALVLAVVLSAALVAAPWASGKGKTKKLTGVVTVYKNSMANGIHIVIALRRGSSSAGKLSFPGCQGTGTSIICGGKLKLKGVGSGLGVLFTWGCPTSKCAKSATANITKPGKTVGSITLKTGPPGKGRPLKKGKHFPVKVKLS